MDLNSFKKKWQVKREEINQWLDICLPKENEEPKVIHQAMRYSVFAGGKRFRAILLASTAEALGFDKEERFYPACALELIHTYSLIHDDLPAMDNDDFRRGKPSSHKHFGEAIAILAGDALLTYAFYILSHYPESYELASKKLRIIEEIALAAGIPGGMVAGQVLDITTMQNVKNVESLAKIHRLKTGALIRVAVRCGVILATDDEFILEQMTKCGEALGLAFQITDDILDVTSSAEELGKTPGKDYAQGKVTYPALLGVEKSIQVAKDTVVNAIEILNGLGGVVKDKFLEELARFVYERLS